MKPLRNLLRFILLLISISFLQAEQTVSNLVGFEVLKIKPRTFNLIGLNTSVNPNGPNARSVGKIFGTTLKNPNIRAANDHKLADIIWTLQDGEWMQIYYAEGGGTFPPLTKGWKAVGLGNTDVSGVMIKEGFIYESKTFNEWGLVLPGYVNDTPSRVTIDKPISIISKGTPVPATFGEILQESSNIIRGNENTADLFWVKNQNKDIWEAFYYAKKQDFPPLTPGWKKVGDGNNEHHNDIISSSAIIVESRDKHNIPRGFTKEPPFGFMDQRKKTTPINPIPKASLKYILDDSILIEDPEMIVFVPYWISDLNLNYTTQYFDNNRWNSLSIRNGTGELMFNYTIVNFLEWGVARVITKEFVEQF